MSEDIAVNNLIDTEELKRDLHIEVADLNSDMQRHSAMYIHYACIAVRARAQADRWKTALEVLESQLDNHYRAVLKEENPKTTEPMIRAAVVNDPKWKAASNRLIEAQSQFRIAEAAERAFEHRKDMLGHIARNQLKEADGQLRVVQNQDNRARILEAIQRNAEKAPSAA